MSVPPTVQDNARRVETLEAKVDALEKIINRIEGAGILIKILIYLVAPVGAIGYYVRNHFTW